MLSLTYDLHLHSCLSPCGDEEMTPANIAGMAAVLGLDVIALTDHNSSKNCPALMAAAREYGVLAIPGMELTTAEEIHAVCLFARLEAALDFDLYVYQRLVPFPNKEEIFGRQLIYDCQDQICGTIPNLLINSTEISFEGLWELVRSFEVLSSTSLLSSLGMIPPDSKFTTAEVKDLKRLHQLKREHPYLEQCRIISNSDAHYLEHIHEPELTLLAEEKSAEAVIQTLLTPLLPE